MDKPRSKKVKVRVIAKKPKKKEDNLESEGKKLLVEALQEETEPPKNPRFKGAQNHSTERETKVEKKFQDKALDPGAGGKKKESKPKKKVAKARPQPRKPTPPITPGLGPSISTIPARNGYESLMPAANELMAEVKSGYQDYIDDEIEIGDRINLNTSDYRYIGYFTSLRKAFELVWTYPREAVRRGLQGEVGVEFVIAKDGSLQRVRVIRSSGHTVLDNAVVEAIKLAAPYSPLPSGLNKKKLAVVAGFRYFLGNSGGVAR